MVDYLKILIYDLCLINKLWNNSKLKFYKEVSKVNFYDSEKINRRMTRSYKGILFTMSRGGLEIRIKPHYYKNNNKHNADIFTVLDCIDVLKSIIIDLEIEDLELLKVVNIEYGINLTTKLDHKKVIKGICYIGKSRFQNYTSKELYYFKDYSNSAENIFKIYSKSYQYPTDCPINTIRIEVKSKKNRHILNKLRIKNLSDLLKEESYNLMKEELIKTFSKVLILYQDLDFSKLSKLKKNKLKEFLNPFNWDNIIENNSINVFRNTKMRYLKLLDEIGFNVHSILLDEAEKCFVKYFDNKKCVQFHRLSRKENVCNFTYI